jgi:hypothetical protein
VLVLVILLVVVVLVVLVVVIALDPALFNLFSAHPKQSPRTRTRMILTITITITSTSTIGEVKTPSTPSFLRCYGFTDGVAVGVAVPAVCFISNISSLKDAQRLFKRFLARK